MLPEVFARSIKVNLLSPPALFRLLQLPVAVSPASNVHLLDNRGDQCTLLSHVRRLLTQQDLHGGFAHVIMTVERLAHLIGQFLDDMPRVLVEQVNEALQHVQVECRGDDASVGPPFVAFEIKSVILVKSKPTL